ncbi:hypothetical protein Tco_0385912 [Tanacetum coccineum]
MLGVVHPDSQRPGSASAKVRNCSSLRIETGNASLRKAFRHNNQQPLTLGFDVDDLGEVVGWQKCIHGGGNGHDGLQLKLRLLWRKNKNRIKAQQYTIYDSPDEAKNHLPPSTVWGERTHDEWNELVDWFSHPNQVSRSMRNVHNASEEPRYHPSMGKNRSAMERNEYSRKGISRTSLDVGEVSTQLKGTGQFKYEENKQRHIRAGVIPYKTDQEILDEVVPSEQTVRYVGHGKEVYPGWWLNFSQAAKSEHLLIGELNNWLQDNASEDNKRGRYSLLQSGGDYSSTEEAEYEEEE